MTATPPTRISLPPRQPAPDVFGGASSPADSPSPSGPYSNRHLVDRSLRPSFSTPGGRRKVSRATLRGLEGLGLDDEDESTKLPTLVPGIRPAYSTPLPVLPMVVLCIVSHFLSIILIDRQCFRNYYQLICVHRSYYPWLKVSCFAEGRDAANKQISSPRQATKKEVREKLLSVCGLVIWSLCSLSLNSSLHYCGVVLRIDTVDGRSLLLVWL